MKNISHLKITLSINVNCVFSNNQTAAKQNKKIFMKKITKNFCVLF